MKKSFHIIGMGRVGQTFAAVLPKSGRWKLAAAVSRKNNPGVLADCLADKIVPRIQDLPPADAILIATPDNILKNIAEQLAQLPWLAKETLVIHFSGAKTICVLDEVVKCGATVGSLHPVFAFADVEKSIRELAGNLCALEAADAGAMAKLHDLAAAAELRAFEISSQQKARYHAALSVASNFSVTLAAFAQDLLAPLHFSDELARELVSGLMRQSVDHLAELPPLSALTGPIVRGDDSTVTAHVSVMDEAERQKYRIWAAATLDLARSRLDSGQIKALEKVLNISDGCMN
ncbi:Rossmann-like and DUF2520 domain-containing protein [Neisseria montereyensis]|uniref:DUF2520 domain-containing protein n=1 Tax=Neisseria montereyensis TaxID=2973938 RepID=A0ABT2FCT4_9NEIS|nr:Rossmann-like and DUF2520 domain-containing protein [Neisseria montereyensis]MCS4533972.1 DUF2520 domain-containing protein [Neisseria montereyensis]